MTFGSYFFLSSISLALFYLFYLLLLRRETFFVFNRIYLLAALCLSMVLPFSQLSWLTALPKTQVIYSTLALRGVNEIGDGLAKELDWLALVYWIGVAIAAVLFLIKIRTVKKQLSAPEEGAAFSFWRTKVIDSKLANLPAINAHEDVHILQLHTVDIVLVEIIKVFFWFNPIVYRYSKSLKAIHEYLADEHASKFTASKKQYAMLLFRKSLNAGSVLANTFYTPSMLEARIEMLQRKKSNRSRIWKYTLCLPLIFMITLFCSFSTSHLRPVDQNKVDQAASFPGGFEAFSKYLIHSGRKVSDKSGSVKVSFIVEPNGAISNEKIESSLNKASDDEALRLIRSSPKWKPALLNGEKVRSGYQIKINFVSDNQ